MTHKWLNDPSLTHLNSTTVDYGCEGCGWSNTFRYPNGLNRLPKVRCAFCGHHQKPPRRRRRPVAAPHAAHPRFGYPFPGEQPKLVPSGSFFQLGYFAGMLLAWLLFWVSPLRPVYLEWLKNSPYSAEKANEVWIQK